MCGIFGVYGHSNAVELTYLGLYSLQHRGQESAGMVVSDGTNASCHKGMGLVSEVFNPGVMKSLEGSVTVGHVRYSTTGSSVAANVQPFAVRSFHGTIAIAHNGNLVNTLELKRGLEEAGAIFQTSMDSELIIHLIAKSKKEKPEEKVIDALSRVRGAYSVLLLVGDRFIAARDPRGFRPLCIGEIDGSYVIASETCAFDITGVKFLREIEPGEIVVIGPDGIESFKPFEKQKKAHCIFEFIYFARPDSNIFGGNVYMVRKRLGRALARELPAGGEVVMSIPDSGNYASLGYSEESGLPFEMGIVRNHYVGRTFIQPFQESRNMGVKLKLNPVREIINGRKIVVIEDSIVRGTTSRTRIKSLRDAGAREIHLRVSCPPLKHPCFYGIDFPTREELVASSHTVAQIAKMIGVDTLGYLSLEGMLGAMPEQGENFCTACFTGKYPEKIGKKISKYDLEC